MPSVLAIAAHPDDIEFLMAGTLLRLAEAGYDLHYWNLCSGSCGSTEQDAAATARIRAAEGRAAAVAMNAVFHESIADDLELFYDKRTLQRVASVIRDVAPQIVLTHAPVDYMEDHTMACRLAVTGTFARGMPNFAVEPPRSAVAGSVTVYHAQPYSHREPLGAFVMPDFFVDVTDLQQRKRELLACHASQKRWLDESQGLDSYLDTMQSLDAELGRASQRFAYAEGWRKHRHLGFCEAADDPLRDALAEHLYCPSSAGTVA